MADIQLRFDKDMLVLSTPFDYQLRSQGFTEPADRAYVVLCEPELVEEAYKLEKVIGTPCFVTPTEGITEACLAQARFDGRAADMAQIAFETVKAFSPQHAVAAIGPSGLPLDPSSAASLKQSKGQYQDAVRALTAYPFDAVLFTGFSLLADVQCALMGARAVYDGPVAITLCPSLEGTFKDGHDLAQAAAFCAEYGADIIGVRSDAPANVLRSYARTMAGAVNRPLMVEIEVKRKDPRQYEPTAENPYPSPDTLVDVAWDLHNAGVQFLRAVGAATPAYTGALVATVAGHDVVLAG